MAVDGFGQVWLTIGLGGTRSAIESEIGASKLTAMLGTEGKISRGKYVKRGDPAAFEESAAGTRTRRLVDTNPNSLVTAGGGSVFVADAGGNSLLKIHFNGSLDVRGVFQPKAPVPNPFDPTAPAIAADAVPTSVTRGRTVPFYIGELTGFPFTPGAANVYKLRPGGSTRRVFATGFTNVMDLAVLPSGEVLVLEIAGTVCSPPRGTLPAGALKKISADGKT